MFLITLYILTNIFDRKSKVFVNYINLLFEEPTQSTEPQNEPWKLPSATYKWYDETTFYAGSYGYSGLNKTPPGESNQPIDFVMGDITNGQQFSVTLLINGLSPYTTYQNYKVGIYNESGTQMGSFDLAGSWNSYGYSNAFAITTDSSGTVKIVFNAKTKPGITGNANIRLKQGTTNKYTESILIK